MMCMLCALATLVYCAVQHPGQAGLACTLLVHRWQLPISTVARLPETDNCSYQREAWLATMQLCMCYAVQEIICIWWCRDPSVVSWQEMWYSMQSIAKEAVGVVTPTQVVALIELSRPAFLGTSCCQLATSLDCNERLAPWPYVCSTTGDERTDDVRSRGRQASGFGCLCILLRAGWHSSEDYPPHIQQMLKMGLCKG
jgi:hypothetical protein